MGEKTKKELMEQYILVNIISDYKDFEFEYDEKQDEVHLTKIFNVGKDNITVPEFVSVIDVCAWCNNDEMDECVLVIPKGCRIELGDGIDASLSDYVKSVIVSEDNEYYTSEDGVLFNKENTVLLVYPSDKDDNEYSIPEGVIKIKDKAFFYNNNLKILNIPCSLECFGNQGLLLTKICVNKGNLKYRSESGSLYSKDGKIKYYELNKKK